MHNGNNLLAADNDEDINWKLILERNRFGALMMIVRASEI